MLDMPERLAAIFVAAAGTENIGSSAFDSP